MKGRPTGTSLSATDVLFNAVGAMVFLLLLSAGERAMHSSSIASIKILFVTVRLSAKDSMVDFERMSDGELSRSDPISDAASVTSEAYLFSSAQILRVKLIFKPRKGAVVDVFINENILKKTIPPDTDAVVEAIGESRIDVKLVPK